MKHQVTDGCLSRLRAEYLTSDPGVDTPLCLTLRQIKRTYEVCHTAKLSTVPPPRSALDVL